MYRRKLLSENDLVDRAEARKWRNSYWTDAYRAKRRIEGIWISVFLLLFALFGGVLIGVLMIAKYGRP